jgi:hypothetical protein
VGETPNAGCEKIFLKISLTDFDHSLIFASRNESGAANHGSLFFTSGTSN